MSQLQSMMDDTDREPPGFRVREATPQDNAALLALDRECVVAAATPVAFDRSPDFFARSRPYSTWRAYVAEGDSGLIGVGAMALWKGMWLRYASGISRSGRWGRSGAAGRGASPARIGTRGSPCPGSAA